MPPGNSADDPEQSNSRAASGFLAHCISRPRGNCFPGKHGLGPRPRLPPASGRLHPKRARSPSVALHLVHLYRRIRLKLEKDFTLVRENLDARIRLDRLPIDGEIPPAGVDFLSTLLAAEKVNGILIAIFGQVVLDGIRVGLAGLRDEPFPQALPSAQQLRVRFFGDLAEYARFSGDVRSGDAFGRFRRKSAGDGKKPTPTVPGLRSSSLHPLVRKHSPGAAETVFPNDTLISLLK